MHGRGFRSLDSVLKHQFGFDVFRRSSVKSPRLAFGEDVLALLPTGEASRCAISYPRCSKTGSRS